ncbi:death-associated inhibitor of apoptosis 1-like [Cydia fagiglandana]|uniref:death-associated inhibitor of apoptosis 1-like n=1 Tax=Cydia fagiglandana TaxID=1458189 RepID=UPI002FEE5624
MTTGQDECGMCAPPATGASVLPHPRYNTKAARLRTFKDWPKSMKQKPEELAEAGFYYTGQSDKTKCFYCDGGLKDWEEDDVPWEQHARWFDRCAYVQLVKGEDYVQKVISKACVIPKMVPDVKTNK